MTVLLEDRAISASQLKTHDRCPLNYRFKYVSGVEPGKESNEYARLGSAVHETIEEILLEAVEPGELDRAEEHTLRPVLLSRFREKTEEWDVPERLIEDGETCCRSAARYLAHRTDQELLGIEQRIKYRIDREDIDTEVTSILDITTDEEIWDWKTGRIRGDETDLAEEIQGATYALAYRHEYGRWPECVRFVYLKEEQVRTLTPDSDPMTTMLQKARRLQAAKRRDEFPANPGDHCYWCPYEWACDAAPVGMGDVDWRRWQAL